MAEMRLQNAGRQSCLNTSTEDRTTQQRHGAHARCGDETTADVSERTRVCPAAGLERLTLWIDRVSVA